MTAAVGPDSMILTGNSAAVSTDVTPPDRQHDKELAGKSDRLQASGQFGQVTAGKRLDVRVRYRRARPLIFLDLGKDVVRDRCRDVRGFLLDQLLDHAFMSRVFERVEKAHGDGLDTHIKERPDDRPCIIGIERLQDRAVTADAFVNLEAVSPSE